MKIKADFHMHTHHSPDSKMAASDLLDRVRAGGLDVIAVTDHNTTQGGIEVRSLAKGNPFVIVGQEVSTLSGEIIVLGPDKDIPKHMSLAETCRMANTMGGFIIVPHPFDRTRKGIGNEMLNVIENVDAVEVLNSRCLFGRYNRKAKTFAKTYGLPMVSGTDAHWPSELCLSFTEVDVKGKLSERSFFDAVLSGRTEVFGRRSGITQRLKTTILKLR
jgi:predicted metal-dependent phosphoesterase TrpH